MKNNKTNRASFLTTCLALLVAFTVGLMPALASASGGGGTVVAGSPTDPGYMVIISSSGGSITVPTTPFQI
jgi:hypothetical protein